MQIARTLRREITRDYSPGDRFPSQNELARRFQVSPPTAREAVGLLVQEGLLERRFGSGTYVTAQQAERWVGVLVELDISQRTTSYYYLRVVQVLRQYFATHGCLTRLYTGSSSAHDPQPPELPTCDEFYRDLEAGKLHALVTLSYRWSRAFESLIAKHKLVAIGEGPRHGAPLMDYTRLIQDAVAYCAAHGRRRIALLGHGRFHHGDGFARDFVQALQAHGLPVDPALMVGVWPGTEHADGIGAFRHIWQEAGHRPDALLVLDDQLYAAIAPILLYNRIVLPDELMVLAHGNAGDDRTVHPEPIRLLFDPDAYAEALGAALISRLDAAPAALAPPSPPPAIRARLVEPAVVAHSLQIG